MNHPSFSLQGRIKDLMMPILFLFVAIISYYYTVITFIGVNMKFWPCSLREQLNVNLSYQLLKFDGNQANPTGQNVYWVHIIVQPTIISII